MEYMGYTIPPNGNLRVTVSPEAQADLQALRSEQNTDGSDRFGSNNTMWDVFQPLIENTDLKWCAPAWIGALTDAPILGIWGENAPVQPNEDPAFYMLAYCDGKTAYKVTWKKAWAFMAHCLRSPQEDLAEQGYCIFESGDPEEKEAA